MEQFGLCELMFQSAQSAPCCRKLPCCHLMSKEVVLGTTDEAGVMPVRWTVGFQDRPLTNNVLLYTFSLEKQYIIVSDGPFTG